MDTIQIKFDYQIINEIFNFAIKLFCSQNKKNPFKSRKKENPVGRISKVRLMALTALG